MSTFKTPKGSVLPILNLRGKDYLEVKYRLVWFREERPDWSIETEFTHFDKESAIAKCIIKDEKGRVLSTGHKFENKQGFPDFHEKAESGSMGRALALLGYGTQFVGDDLDEGKRIVDTPVEPKKDLGKTIPGSYMINFGKFKGSYINAIPKKTLAGYVRYLNEGAEKSGAPLGGPVADLVSAIEEYIRG